MDSLLSRINEAVQPYLDEEERAFRIMVRKEQGCSYGGFLSEENGETLHEKLNREDVREELEDIDELFTEILYGQASSFSKCVFSFKKGEAASFRELSVEEIIFRITGNLERERMTKDYDILQGLCVFLREDRDYLKTEVRSSMKRDGAWKTEDFGGYIGFREDCEVLFYKTGRDLERIMFEVTREESSIFSVPPKVDLGWRPLTGDMFHVSKALKKRMSLIEEAAEQRLGEYGKIGKVEIEVYAPLVSPMLTGGYRWPANRPQFRVLYTDKSTVIISDGLSDPFEKERYDPDMKYNGYAVEFFVEFEGKIPFDALKDHYCQSLLHQVTQSAVAHGEFNSLLKNNPSLSMQLSGGELSDPYCDREGRWGVLMNVPSENVPPVITLNLEKVLLAGCRLLTIDELDRCGDEKEGEAARKQLLEKFNKEGSFCYSPFDV